MGRNGTRDMNDYLDDYENAAKDYSEMGPMWAELVFPDDDDALRAIYGGRDNQTSSYSYDEEDYSDHRRR
jgi:hypothetical protein